MQRNHHCVCSNAKGFLDSEESDENGSGQEIHDDDDEDLHDKSLNNDNGSGEKQSGKKIFLLDSQTTLFQF